MCNSAEVRERLEHVVRHLRALRRRESTIPDNVADFVADALDGYLRGQASTLDAAFGLSPEQGDEKIVDRRAATEASALTRRQNQVLALLSQGQTNSEIALALGISQSTVKLHLWSIRRALGGSNRTTFPTGKAFTPLDNILPADC